MNDKQAIEFLAGTPPLIETDRLAQGVLKPPRIFAVNPALLPDIDISIVTYHSQIWLAPFFASLMAQDYPLEKLHMILTDHSGNDNEAQALADAVEPLRARFATCSIEQRENRGFGAGHNRALETGTSDFLLITNIDLTFASETLTRLAAEALASPGDVAAWECRQKPYEHPKAYDIVTQTTAWSSGACLLLRRTAFVEVGGFDDTFFMYGEDVDLSGRLRANGWKLRYVPGAVVWHYSYGSPNQVKETQYFHGAIGNAYLRLRYGNPWDWVVGAVLQLYLVVHRQRFRGKHRTLARNYGRILRNAWHFLSTRQENCLFLKNGITRRSAMAHLSAAKFPARTSRR